MNANTPNWPPHLIVVTVVERDGRHVFVEERIHSQAPAVNSGERSPLHNAFILLLLAAAYWRGAYFVAAFSGGIDTRWAHQLQQLAGLPAHTAPIVLLLIGALGLLIIATPLAGILTALYSRHAAAGALLVAIPAAASLLYDVYILCQTGLQIPASALELIGFDVIKTLLILLLLTLAVQRWLPSRL